MENETPPFLFPSCGVCHQPRSFTHLHSCCATAIKHDGDRCPVCGQELFIAQLLIDLIQNPYRLN